MSSSMYNLLEAYSAVYNQDVREDLDSQRDYISEMQICNLTKSDLVEIAEEVVEIMLSSGISIKESQQIVGSLFTKSNITGRQQKIDRLQEAFQTAFRELTSKASNTAVEEFGKYRNSKKLQESWSARFNQDKRVERVHNRLVAEEIASTKELLILMIEEKDDSYLETDMKKRAKNNEKALADMKTTKAHKDMVGAARRSMGIGEALDPVGEEDDDIDNDGDSDESDEYLKKRRKAIGKSMKKRGKKREDGEKLDEADSLAAMQARREKRLKAQRKREGTTAAGNDFGHDYSLTPAQQKARRDAEFKAGMKKEEFDVFDTILEFLYVEGYVDTLEEAEWMMANLIDEEAIDIILGEEQLDEADSVAAMRERSAKRRQQRYGKQGGGGYDRYKPLTQADYERGAANDPRKKVKNEEFELDEDSRRTSNKQHTARVRSNIKSFGNNYTPPSNYDPDANRGQGEVLTRKQIEKKRRKALRQEEFESWLDEAMSNYEKNRKRAAQRAAARNEARKQGKTGAVPGVGYVTKRPERETWTDESGKTRHAKGL